MLGEVARGVRLATDGDRRTMLRFEVAEGDLRGTRIAVTSDRGTISAVVSPPASEAISPVALESALESVRLSLEGRGISVAALEVRPDDQRGGRPSHHEHDAPPGTEAPIGQGGASPGRAPSSGSATVDYFV